MREIGFEPVPSDMCLFIRDGLPVLRTPTHDGGQVPEDFLILMGIAASWADPRFRNLMKALMREAAEAGHLEGIVTSGHEPVH